MNFLNKNALITSIGVAATAAQKPAIDEAL